MFGIKTPRMPSQVVYETTGSHCPAFEPSPRIKDAKNAKDTTVS